MYEKKQEELERIKTMNKLEQAIADIHSPTTEFVVKFISDHGCLHDSLGDTGEWNSSSIVRDHYHRIYGKKVSVPSETSVSNVIADLKVISLAVKDELMSIRTKIASIGNVIAESSELVLAFKQTHDVLVSEMDAEQASHRRFEQLVQTLDAKVREVRAIYDTIDVAIKKATDDVASSVIKQIEDKGESVTSAMEQDVKRRIEEMLKVVFSKARDNMSKVAAEKTESVQTELAEMRQKFDSAVDDRMQSVKSDMEQQLAQQLEKLLQRGNEHVSRLDDMSLKIDKRVGEIEQRLNDMISAAETKLTMDVRSEVPALFRSNTGGSSFLRRLKWLFFGRV